MLPNISLRQLTILVAFAEKGGMTAAGRAIGLSHSAVSLQLRALEEALAADLIDRSSRPPRLTEEGRAVVSQARQVAGLVEEMAAAGAGGEKGARRGVLTLGVVPSAFVHLAAPTLAHLRQAAPGIAVRLRAGLSGDLAEAVRSGSLDAALLTRPGGSATPPGLDVRPLVEEPLELIAAPALAAEGAGLDAEQRIAHLVRHQPFIWFSRRAWAGRQIEQALAARGLAPAEAMEVDALDAIEALVRHGLGVSVVPRPAGARDEVRQGLFTLPLPGEGASRALCLIEREGHPKAHLVSALAAAAAEVLAPSGAPAETSGIPQS
ncbi:MAG: LysR family transcriptional regulator [Pseudomonadota bacterium]